jgi:acyl-CoA thioester hydrolase
MGARPPPVESAKTITAPPRISARRFARYRHPGPGSTVRAVRLDLEPSLDPAAYAFTHRLRVRFAETDAMGIVHHSRYLPYLEEARVEYLRHLGHPYTELRAAGVDYAVLEAFVQYRAPLRFDDLVDVHLHLGSATRATFQMAYLLTVDGQARATAVTVHGCVNGEGRPTRMPAWLSRLAT